MANGSFSIESITNHIANIFSRPSKKAVAEGPPPSQSFFQVLASLDKKDGSHVALVKNQGYLEVNKTTGNITFTV